MCNHEIRVDGICDCGEWYDPSVLDRELSPATDHRSVETQTDVSPGGAESGNARLDHRDRLLSAPGPKVIALLPDARVALPDANEPIGALARASITRPLRYCPTCRDTHAEDAPHFLNRTRENGPGAPARASENRA